MATVMLATSGLTIPPAGALNAAAAPRGLAVAGARSLIPVTYGLDRQPALILNVLPKAGDANTLLVQCLWGHALHAVSEPRLNDQALPAGSTITHYTGGQGAPDATLVAAFAAQGITYTDTLAGYAYSVLAMPTRSFNGELNVSALLSGRLVYDPRFDAITAKDTRSAVPGTPGTMPTGWTFSSAAGIAREVVGTGVEDGLQYLDVRYHGTAAALSFAVIGFGELPASPGEQWKGACNARLVAGSMAGISGAFAQVESRNSGGFISGATSGTTYQLTAAALRAQRLVTNELTLALLTSASRVVFALQVPASAVIDITVRVAMPMMWKTTDTADVVAWSDTPSLALADWLSSGLYGAGEPVLWSSVPAAANANDATVGDPPEKRRVVGVTLSRDGVTCAAVAEALRAYAGCWLVPTSGGIKLLPDAPDAAVASYSHASGEIAGLEALSLRDLGDAPTAVEIRYTDTQQIPWRVAPVVVSLPGAGTTRPWRISAVALPGVQRYSQAYREAVERLNKLNLGDLNFPLDVFDQGIAHEKGDIVTVSHPLGLDAKPMRVTDVEMIDHGRWRLSLTEHDPAAYSDEVQTSASIPDTTRVNTGGPADPVAGFAGTVTKGRIAWVWTPSTYASYAYTEVRSADSNWGSTTTPPLFRGNASGWQELVSSTGDRTRYARHFDTLANPSDASAAATVSVAAGDLVQDGAPGQNVARVRIYQRAASAPAVPSATVTFTFASGAIAGLNNGWSATIPAGSNPLYITEASAAAAGTTDTIATGEWASPVILAQDGAAGATGADGINSATIFLYQRNDTGTAPAVPGTTTFYDFATGVLSGTLGSWAQSVPAESGGRYLFVTTATALSSAAADIIATGEWAVVRVLAQDGLDGAPGQNVARVRIYQRATSAPAVPSATVTFTFASGAIAGLNNGWSATIPAGSNPLYITEASAAAAGTTDTIATGEWASPVILAQDGAAGATGINSATVFLYQRNSTGTPPAVPASSTTYTFATGVLSGTLGSWTQSVPAEAGGKFCFITTATALSAGTTDTIATGEWAAVRVLAQDGLDGAPGDPGAPGAAAVAAAVAPASVVLAADSTGLVAAGQLPTTITASVKLGAATDTGAWTWTRTSTTGITTTISGAVVTITAMDVTADSGSVTITGTKAGADNVVLVVPVTKAKSAITASGPRDFATVIAASRIATGTDATAEVRLTTAGAVEMRLNGGSWTSRGVWYQGTVSGSYSVRCDVLGSALTSGTVGAFQALSSTRTWTVTRSPPTGETNSVLTLLVSNDSTGEIVCMGTVNLIAIYEA